MGVCVCVSRGFRPRDGLTWRGCLAGWVRCCCVPQTGFKPHTIVESLATFGDKALQIADAALHSSSFHPARHPARHTINTSAGLRSVPRHARLSTTSYDILYRSLCFCCRFLPRSSILCARGTHVRSRMAWRASRGMHATFMPLGTCLGRFNPPVTGAAGDVAVSVSWVLMMRVLCTGVFAVLHF